MLILEAIECSRKRSVVVVDHVVLWGDDVTFLFTLTDPEDGTRVRGRRSFPVWTHFDDMADFVSELWCSNDLVELPRQARTTLRERISRFLENLSNLSTMRVEV